MLQTWFETTAGGTWRIAGCRDWYSKYVSVRGMCHWLGTSTMRSPGVELTLADYHSLIRAATGRCLPNR